MSPARLGYTLLIHLLLPLALLRLRWRARKTPAYGEHIGERFGRYAERPTKPVIWLHAVSLGETRAAAPLVRALLKRYPQHQILITHMTPTGRAASRELFGDQVLRAYLPYDAPFAVRRFLRHFCPALGVIMETEIWPNLIRACRRRGVPLALANARLSERSAQTYARHTSLTRTALRELALIAAQTADDARRLQSLGASRVEVCGNLKFDLQVAAEAVALGKSLREKFGSARAVFLAASTRDGEEAIVLDAVAKIAVPQLLTVIVPRHPERFDEVAHLIDARGLPMQRRSQHQPIAADTKVVLGDSMGELLAYYAACDVAFVGGSLVPTGGQNLIEACAVGAPVLIGPHTFNFDEAAAAAIDAGAARRVQNAAELATEVERLLQDAEARKSMSEAGRNFVRLHQGATAKLMRAIDALLAARRAK